MDEKVEHDALEESLQRCGASWGASQAHGLLAGRLCVAGVAAGPDWLLQVLEGVEQNNALRGECQKMLDTLYQAAFWQLSERLSEFALLMPDDESAVDERTIALAHWCEGFLHGLVASKAPAALKTRLAADPLDGIIKDLLQITRAGSEEDADDEENEAALFELVEYVRVATQLCYEELADLRNAKDNNS